MLKEYTVKILPFIHHPEITLDEAYNEYKTIQGRRFTYWTFASYVDRLRGKGWIVT